MRRKVGGIKTASGILEFCSLLMTSSIMCRCAQCNKILTLDTYASHQGVIYCKPHHKDLFKPKAVTKDSVEEIMKKNIDFSVYNEDNIGSTPFHRNP